MNLMNLSSKIKKRIIEIETASDRIRVNFLEKLPDLRRFKKLQKKALLSVHEIMNIIGIDKGLILGKAK